MLLLWCFVCLDALLLGFSFNVFVGLYFVWFADLVCLGLLL